MNRARGMRVAVLVSRTAVALEDRAEGEEWAERLQRAEDCYRFAAGLVDRMSQSARGTRALAGQDGAR